MHQRDEISISMWNTLNVGADVIQLSRTRRLETLIETRNESVLARLDTVLCVPSTLRYIHAYKICANNADEGKRVRGQHTTTVLVVTL